MTAYRPSAVLKLTMRTEEFNDTATLVGRLPDPFTPDATLAATPAPPATTTAGDDSAADALERNQQRRRALEARRDSMPEEDYRRQLLDLTYERQDILEAQRDGGDGQGGEQAPQSVAGAPPDDLTVVGTILPMSARIERNSTATADTATVSIAFADAPIDPRILRAAAIELVVGIVPAADYEAGMERGERRRDGSLRSVVEASGDGTLRGATRFCGFVDDWTTEYDGEAGDVITLECRDASAQLRDMMLPSGASIDLTLPLDEGVRRFLETVSATTRGVRVLWEASGDPPTPEQAMPRRLRPRRGRVARRARRGGESMSLWDHIQDVVRGQGFMPMVRGWDVVITDPRTLYSAADAKRMVYGRNLSNLSFSRRLGGVKVPTIEVRCFDAERGRTLWARYPVASSQRASGVLNVDEQPQPTRANEVPPSGANPDEGVRVMLVSGYNDPSVLERVARSVFEGIGRQEIKGSFVTNDVWSYGAEPDDADLLSLEAGAPVELLLARSTGTADETAGSNASLAQLQAMDRRRRSDYMVGLGWSRTVAERFAALQDATGFQTVFRTDELSVAFDSEEGLKMTVAFINYITVREEGA